MTYWHNCVVYLTNFCLPPALFSSKAPNFILRDSKSQWWLWGASGFSYLHFLLPSSFSNTQDYQWAQTDSLTLSCPPSAVPLFLLIQQNAYHPHHPNGTHNFFHWDFQPIHADHFSEGPISLFAPYPSLNKLILFVLYYHIFFFTK